MSILLQIFIVICLLYIIAILYGIYEECKYGADYDN